MKNDLPVRNDLPLTRCGAAQLAGLIARGEASASEVLAQHIEQVHRVQPRLNAMSADRFDAARAEALAADAARKAGAPLGALHGVPVTIKESLDVAGMASTFGLPSRRLHRAEADEVHVARLRAAGAIVMGKTNVAQALLFYEADNPLYGRTNNPFNPLRTCGGSSGGEAALVASHASPLGLGTDIGGSVRIPAAFCGVVGFKPTSGRCDDLGRFSVPMGQRAVPSQVGALARSVEDVALALRVVNGGAHPEVPGQPLADFRGVPVRGLRIACYADDGTFTPMPAAARAVHEAAEALRAAGAHVTDWTPPGVQRGLELFLAILGADSMALLKQRMALDPRSPQLGPLMTLAALPRPAVLALQRVLRAVGQASLARGLGGFGYSRTRDYWSVVEELHDYREHFLRSLDHGSFDAILCPPSALPAWTHGAARDLAMAGAYACLYNLLGFPAGVVPVTHVRDAEAVGRSDSRDVVQKVARRVEQGSAGLPMGVQVVARPWHEHVALAAMAAIERAAAAGQLALTRTGPA